VEIFKNEFSHGVDHGTNDKLNEPIYPSFIITKGYQD
jgi:hypothetical protein